jgi:hypothetical protein
MRDEFDGSQRLFRIGIKPLDPADWLLGGPDLPAALAEKQHLFANRRDEVFAAEPGTAAAQGEVLDLVCAHLRRDPPPAPEPPLLAAARLVAEDLLLLRRDATGWRLVAAALCFPSSWVLTEKLGLPIEAIHAPVPGFGAGTRNAALIARMFDAARPDTPMLRWNWSLYGDDRLFHPDLSPPERFGSGSRADPVFLRLERQTLRRLPASGDLLFTVRILLDPLGELERQPEGPALAAVLLDQLAALDPAELDYKGLRHDYDRITRRLAEMRDRQH